MASSFHRNQNQKSEPVMWQPIETAPTDVEIQVYTVCGWEPRARLIENHSGEKFWQVWAMDDFDGMDWIRLDERVTHWMPIPQPPPSETEE